MVERKTTQTLEDPIYTGTFRNRTATTTKSTTTADSATIQPDLRPPVQPDPDRQRPSKSLVSQMFRCSILAVVMALVWVAAFSWILPSSTSNIPTEGPDFAYLVLKQASIFETFSDALARLNIHVNLGNACLYQHGTDGDNAYHATNDPHGLFTAAMSGYPLQITMKNAELAIVDLKVAVLNSRLSEVNKSLLANNLKSLHLATKAHTRKLVLLSARSKGCLDRQVVQNVFLSTELNSLRVDVLDRVLSIFSSVDDRHLHETYTKTRLQKLYLNAFEEGRNELRLLVLQIQDLQLGLDDMEETRRRILDIMGREQGKQLQLQEDIMAYVWTHLGGHQVEQETYRENLALLKSINEQSKLTGGGLQWIYLRLIDYEAELKEIWEGMVEAGMVAAKDGGGWGAGASPLSAHKAGVYKKKYSLQNEIKQIKRVTIKLKAKLAQVGGKLYAQAV
ncbi:MAG: hypothetical protein J3R72DRAFT_446981 [Linnemannia gamsii]|nr:MAG: hypothetical protein J3R72DRAFT_446981 [Linnemannia gamsii]